MAIRSTSSATSSARSEIPPPVVEAWPCTGTGVPIQGNHLETLGPVTAVPLDLPHFLDGRPLQRDVVLNADRRRGNQRWHSVLAGNCESCAARVAKMLENLWGVVGVPVAIL